MESVRSAFPDFHNRIVEMIAEDDRVFARLSYTGTHSGSLFGIPPTGRRIEYAGAASFLFHEGRFAEGWVLGDVHGLRQQVERGKPAAVGSERGSRAGGSTAPAIPREIVWRLHLRSSPERVYELLTSDEGRSRFWAEAARERDGCIHFEFINGVRTMSPIVERRPHEQFAIRYFDSDVVFALAPDGAGGTDVKMTNSGFAEEDYFDLLPGWLNVLFPLKGAADFGIDLRNHDSQRTWGRRYIDQ
jgi:hypothetical protein